MKRNAQKWQCENKWVQNGNVNKIWLKNGHDKKNEKSEEKNGRLEKWGTPLERIAKKTEERQKMRRFGKMGKKQTG